MPAAHNSIPEDTLLLCLDMQPVFVRAVADGIQITRRCAFAISAAVGIGVPIAFTEQVPQKLGNTDPALLELAPQAAVWGKNTFSALGDDGIRDAILRQRDVQHLLICGVETSVCVYQTAIAGIVEGLQVSVLSDAVGARRSNDAESCLAALGRAGVHVLPSETVFYALLHDVSHPFFRAYTQLVKSHG
jgi:nicotinamidase-related amidase